VEEAFFRVAQEALSNAFRHARARRVRVAATLEPEMASLRVEDDGVGFDAAARRPGGGAEGLGLASMRERLEALGGGLRLQAAPGAGTRVEAWLPRRAATR
jgi:signal transduction histidine kinase